MGAICSGGTSSAIEKTSTCKIPKTPRNLKNPDKKVSGFSTIKQNSKNGMEKSEPHLHLFSFAGGK